MHAVHCDQEDIMANTEVYCTLAASLVIYYII